MAEYGGVLFIEQSNVPLGGSTLNNNTAQSDTLAAGKGGAIFVDGRSGVAITNCSIIFIKQHSCFRRWAVHS